MLSRRSSGSWCRAWAGVAAPGLSKHARRAQCASGRARRHDRSPPPCAARSSGSATAGAAARHPCIAARGCARLRAAGACCEARVPARPPQEPACRPAGRPLGSLPEFGPGRAMAAQGAIPPVAAGCYRASKRTGAGGILRLTFRRGRCCRLGRVCCCRPGILQGRAASLLASCSCCHERPCAARRPPLGQRPGCRHGRAAAGPRAALGLRGRAAPRTGARGADRRAGMYRDAPKNMKRCCGGGRSTRCDRRAGQLATAGSPHLRSVGCSSWI